MKHKTEMTLPVELTFDVLEPMQIDDVTLPMQLDITRVLLTVVGPGGKPRQVDITKTLSEEQMFLLEDDIVENYTRENH
jgi:hypothetical protein